MTHKTKGIILRAIRYGETSLIVTVFTELFGMQTYIINGIRTSKRSGARAAMFQPGAILDMEVYHNALKSMHRIKESNWSHLFNNIHSDVIKNSITLFVTELLYKSLKQPEQNTDLFNFCEDALLQLDLAENTATANFPLFFSLHLAEFLGFKIAGIKNNSSLNEADLYIDLKEGEFIDHQPLHPYFVEGKKALLTAELLNCRLFQELEELKLNQLLRRELLLKYMEYYALHIPDFGQMKTLGVLQEILG